MKNSKNTKKPTEQSKITQRFRNRDHEAELNVCVLCNGSCNCSNKPAFDKLNSVLEYCHFFS